MLPDRSVNNAVVSEFLKMTYAMRFAVAGSEPGDDDVTGGVLVKLTFAES